MPPPPTPNPPPPPPCANNVNEWNRLDSKNRSSSIHNILPNSLLKVIQLVKGKILNVNTPIGIKMLRKLRLGFSYLHELKFRESFKDTLNLLCFCKIEAKKITHYFRRCHLGNENLDTLMNNSENICISFSTINDNNFVNAFLHGDEEFDDTDN